MTPYAYNACTQEKFAPYCHALASPFEVCPEIASQKLYNCSSRLYSQFCSVYISLMVGKIRLLLLFHSIIYDMIWYPVYIYIAFKYTIASMHIQPGLALAWNPMHGQVQHYITKNVIRQTIDLYCW